MQKTGFNWREVTKRGNIRGERGSVGNCTKSSGYGGGKTRNKRGVLAVNGEIWEEESNHFWEISYWEECVREAMKWSGINPVSAGSDEEVEEVRD